MTTIITILALSKTADHLLSHQQEHDELNAIVTLSDILLHNRDEWRHQYMTWLLLNQSPHGTAYTLPEEEDPE